MSEHIRLKKGLNIPIAGVAAKEITKTVSADVVFIKPTDFRGLVPKLQVKEGDRVLAGQPLFVDKAHQEIVFCSPCSGIVEEIVRGEKRKLLGVKVKADATCEYVQHPSVKVDVADAATIKQALLERGLWPMIQQRPYGIVANPEATPKSIFVSAMATAPLAADLDFVLSNQLGYIQVAINALAKLTKGGIHLGLDAETYLGSEFHKLNNVIQHTFSGPHPAGNVGVQINHISPINKGEIVWTVDLLSLATIGKCLKEGQYDVTRLIAVTGPAAVNPSYVKGIQGMSVSTLAEYFGEKINEDASGLRIVSGNVLTGTNVGPDGYLGFFDNQVTILSEGDYYEMFGWINPLRLNKFSFSRTYWSRCCKKKLYNMDTNTNGGERAFFVSDVYGKVLPMDIYPVYLFKACLAKDIEKMESLGIYEIIEEDIALCEYVCPSKIEIQSIVSDAINLMLKEMA